MRVASASFPCTLVVLIATGGCVSDGSALRTRSETLKSELQRARSQDAMRCAPRELATAESNLSFAQTELEEGISYRAEQHLDSSEAATKKALELTAACAKPVVVAKALQDTDGDGIPDDADKCPTEAGPASNQGCPVKDSDSDGVADNIDKCPTVPGPASNQGCPVDTDGDGIPDDVDKCPNDPGPESTQGCPVKYKMVVVTKSKIQIKKQIKFATGSAKIVGKESFDILDDVAQALKDNAQIKKMRIEGHTDSVGADDLNLRLSQKRADSVMAEILKRGVDPARLEAVGYGETKPIASNTTVSGRAENRRTEFNIVDQ